MQFLFHWEIDDHKVNERIHTFLHTEKIWNPPILCIFLREKINGSEIGWSLVLLPEPCRAHNSLYPKNIE